MFSRATLTACPSCSCQFFIEEPACPHCGTLVRQGDGRGAQRAAAALLLGLAVAATPLAACGDDTAGAGGSGGEGGDLSVQSAYGIAPSVGPGGGDVGGADPGAGGSPGAGGDGGVDAGSGGNPGTGGEGGGDAGSGGSAGTGGAGGGVAACAAEVVEDGSDCDAACDQFVTNSQTGAVMCTTSCEVSEDCSDDGTVVCAEDEVGNTACLFDCSGDNACPGTQYVCDQLELLCLPDDPNG